MLPKSWRLAGQILEWSSQIDIGGPLLLDWGTIPPFPSSDETLVMLAIITTAYWPRFIYPPPPRQTGPSWAKQ
jgi:hypothetical protein